MNPELWSLVQDAGIESLLREAAVAHGESIVTFQNVADVLSRKEPPARHGHESHCLFRSVL